MAIKEHQVPNAKARDLMLAIGDELLDPGQPTYYPPLS